MRHILHAHMALRSGIWSVVFSMAFTTLLMAGPYESSAMLAPAEPAAPALEANTMRAQDLERVQKVLEAKVVRQRLEDLGLSPEEASAKLDRLSDTQLHQLALQIESLLPGGDSGLVWTIVGILLIVVLIVLLATLL